MSRHYSRIITTDLLHSIGKYYLISDKKKLGAYSKSADTNVKMHVKILALNTVSDNSSRFTVLNHGNKNQVSN